jgi:hypothetical protein
MMPPADRQDVTSTLTDLERKLVDLERELSDVASGSSGPVAPLVPETSAGRRDAGLRVEDLRGEIADLVKFRDQLEAAARELVTEYDRLVARLQTSAPNGDAETAPEPPPADVPEAAAPPGPPEHQLPAAVAAGMPGQTRPAAATPPSAGDTMSFVGAVVVDAGPFSDITTLQSFEQGLSRVDGAEDVYVRSFEGNRALIDVRLSNPVPLVHLLREQLDLPIITREAGEGRLTVDLTAADSHGT